MRRLVAFVLSLVTLLGGHCLNGRWDRVVLFAALILLWVGSIWLGLGWWMLRDGFDSAAFYASTQAFTFTLSGGVVVLLMVSAATAAWDAGRAAPATPYTPAGVIGGILLTVVVAAVTIPMLLASAAWTSQMMAVSADADYSFGDEFWHTAMYGGQLKWDGAPPPEGASRLLGRIVHAGEPVKGVKLTAYLNEAYETPELVTDDNGQFQIFIEPGRWRLNAIRTTQWRDRPQGDYLLISGYEPRLRLPYHRVPHKDAVELEAQLVPEQPHVELQIVPALEVEWPPAAAGAMRATPESRIKWRSPMSADQFLVSIQSVEGGGNNTVYSSLIWLRVANVQELKLGDLPMVDAEGEHRYAVEIHAFDESGRLLTRSAGSLRAHGFKLAGRRLVALTHDMENPLPALEDVQGREAAARELRAVRELIQADKLQEAESRLSQIPSEYAEPGHLPRLRGYLAAKQGNCAQAQQWFDQAKREDPRICIADSWRGACGQLVAGCGKPVPTA